MIVNKRGFAAALFIVLLAAGCASVKPKIPIDQGSIEPGGVVARGEMRFKLLGTPLSVGKPLPSLKLVDAATLKDVDLSQERGKVLFVSIVPSIDTAVCEEQSHYLGEEGNKLSGDIRRIIISRDTPFAQRRFAKEAKLGHLQYLSDYKEGDFGRSTGLLVEGSMLLSRSIVVVDKKGTVRYIQVVPDISHLPDMERAFLKAMEFVKEGD